jgi:uncharacterized Fe-S cluster protein YjdI
MHNIIKEYSNGEVTVVWKPSLCIHSTHCFSGLPEVFQPSERPWVKVDNSTTEKIIEQVKKCPSRALSYYLNADKEQSQTTPENDQPMKIEILKNGPIMIKGKSVVVTPDGKETVKEDMVFLCRCGASKNKPYCDGNHMGISFKG